MCPSTDFQVPHKLRTCQDGAEDFIKTVKPSHIIPIHYRKKKGPPKTPFIKQFWGPKGLTSEWVSRRYIYIRSSVRVRGKWELYIRLFNDWRGDRQALHTFCWPFMLHTCSFCSLCFTYPPASSTWTHDFNAHHPVGMSPENIRGQDLRESHVVSKPKQSPLLKLRADYYGYLRNLAHHCQGIFWPSDWIHRRTLRTRLNMGIMELKQGWVEGFHAERLWLHRMTGMINWRKGV